MLCQCGRSDRRLTERRAGGILKWGYRIVCQSRNCGCSRGLFCLVIGYSRWRGFSALGLRFVYFIRGFVGVDGKWRERRQRLAIAGLGRLRDSSGKTKNPLPGGERVSKIRVKNSMRPYGRALACGGLGVNCSLRPSR